MSANPVDTPSGTSPADLKLDANANNLILPAVFVSAAALIIGLLDPIYINFLPQPVITLTLTAMCIVLVWFGVLQKSRVIFAVGSALVIVLVALEAGSQPASLASPLNLIWPLRILIFAVLVACWALLMQPPTWLRRSIFAFFIPTVLILAAWCGPTLSASVFGSRYDLLATNFAPFWLAVDSSGTVYASGRNGGLIRVFDNSGSPVGALRPSSAPALLTPGPGILPNGMEEEIIRSGLAGPTATPIPSGAKMDAEALVFCGVVVDAQDNLYTLSLIDTNPYTIMKFDRYGFIKDRIVMPGTEAPSSGCLAVDNDHLYVTSFTGHLYIMDHDGHVQREAQLPFQPAAIASARDGRLVAITTNSLALVDVNSGQVTPKQLPLSTPSFFAAVVVAPNGEILLADTNNINIMRLDSTASSILGVIGFAGTSPGQFGEINGLVFDKEGRLFVADWLHHVIQRFTPDYKIDAVWWAANTEVEVTPTVQ